LKQFLRMSHQERLALFGKWIDEERLVCFLVEFRLIDRELLKFLIKVLQF
jgi:hypothetical protein